MTHRRPERTVRKIWLVALLALLLLQCNRGSTDLLVVVYSEYPAGTGDNAISRVRVNACPYGGAAASAESFCSSMTQREFDVAPVENPESGDFALPLSFVVRLTDARPNPRTFIEVAGLRGGAYFVRHRVIVSFLEGQRSIVRVYLRRGCEPCTGATQTSCADDNLTVCVEPRVLAPAPFSAANPRGSEFDGGDVVMIDASAMDATAPTDEPVIDAPPPIDRPSPIDAPPPTDVPSVIDADVPLVDATADLPPDDPSETPCVACTLQPRQVWPPSGAVIREVNPRVEWTVAGGLPTQFVLSTASNRAFTAGVSSRTLPNTATNAELPVEPGRTVFWRIQAANRDGSIFSSAVWAFDVTANAAASESMIARPRGTPLDVNGDGRGDVVVTAMGDPTNARRNLDGLLLDTIAVFFGGSAATTQSQLLQVPTGSTVREIRGPITAAGDLNGDGFGDLAVSAKDAVLVYLGSATGLSMLPSTTVETASLSLVSALSAAGDLDHDGYADLLVATTSAESPVIVYRGGPDSISTAPGRVFLMRYSGTGAPVDALLGSLDLDGDGFFDVVARNTTPSGTTLLTTWLSSGRPLNDSVVPTATPVTLDPSTGFTRVNLDDDARDEIAFFGTGAARSNVVRLLRASVDPPGLVADSAPILTRSMGAFFSGIATGDANNDGSEDLVGADSESNMVTGHFGGSPAEMAGPAAYTPCSTMDSVAIAPHFSTANTARVIVICRRMSDMTDVLVAGGATGNMFTTSTGLTTLTVMNMGSPRALAPPIVY